MARNIEDRRNLIVANAQETAQLFQRLFGWDIRWEGIVMGDTYAIHMDAWQADGRNSYITISDRGPVATHTDGGDGCVGVLVEDLQAAAHRAETLGLEPHQCGDGADDRFCFEDGNGIAVKVRKA